MTASTHRWTTPAGPWNRIARGAGNPSLVPRWVLDQLNECTPVAGVREEIDPTVFLVEKYDIVEVRVDHLNSELKTGRVEDQRPHIHIVPHSTSRTFPSYHGRAAVAPRRLDSKGPEGIIHDEVEHARVVAIDLCHVIQDVGPDVDRQRQSLDQEATVVLHVSLVPQEAHQDQ